MSLIDKCKFYVENDGMKWIMTDFSDIQEEAGYERISYLTWRKLKNIEWAWIEKDIDNLGQKGIKITIPTTELLIECLYFPFNDNSFGEYLWNNFEFIKSETLSPIVGTVDSIEKEKRKDNDNMNFNFDFGPCTNDNVRMSMYGIAVKNSDGVWVSYDKNGKQIMDVDIFNFDGRKFIYKIPVAVKDIAVGDVVVHKRVPMFVESVENGIHVVDVFAGEKKNILPTSNMFGFNFVTKIVSVVDMGNVNANENNPFGNMLPFMLFADGDKNNKDFDPLMLMMLMNGGQFGDFSKNPLMLYALFGTDNKDMLLPLMLMNNGNFTLPQPAPKVENPEG